jgi:hypothetical protein
LNCEVLALFIFGLLHRIQRDLHPLEEVAAMAATGSVGEGIPSADAGGGAVGELLEEVLHVLAGRALIGVELKLGGHSG